MIEVIKAVYYFLWIPILLYEFVWIANCYQMSLNRRDYYNKVKLKIYETDDDFKGEVIISVLRTLYILIVLILGLFTINYIVIILYFLYSLIYSQFQKFYRNKNIHIYTILNSIDTLVSILFILFVILNEYHFRINILDYI